jgi:Clostripain family
MAAAKQWTVLVWIAGDNNLDDYGLKDIAEMKQVGSGDQLDVVVQYDRSDGTSTRRYHLRHGTQLEDDLVGDLGETNTGDPAVAIDFFTWGMQQYPSEKVLAVMWNHGSGIDETDIYGNARSRGVAHRVAAGPVRRALFSTTVRAALSSRAIAYDDSARDFLDNLELKRVLEQVTARAGRPLDVLGFDACLMSMIELDYELRDYVGHVVGSEQTEPGNGWPYDDVLRALAANPAMSGAQLAASAVQEYIASYDGGDEDVTQSSCDLSRAAAATQAVDALAGALLGAFDEPTGYQAIARAAKKVQRFEMKDFADLGDFCARLISEQAGNGVGPAAQAVLDAVTGAGGLVSQNGWKGDGVQRATGSSIYLPIAGDVMVDYDRLAFADQTRWGEFLARYREA